MKKRKCPHCGKRNTSENKDYFSCLNLNCGFIHKKTEKEKNEGIKIYQ